MENMQKKSKGPLAAMIACALLGLGGISFGITAFIINLNSSTKPSGGDTPAVVDQPNNDVADFGTYRIEKYAGDPYYIYQDDYEGEYNIQVVELFMYREDREVLDDFVKTDVLSYDEYKAFCEKWNFDQAYTNEDADRFAIIADYSFGSPRIDVELAYAQEEGEYAWLYYHSSAHGVTADVTGYAIVVPVSENIEKVVPVSLYNEEEFDSIKHPFNWHEVDVKKPIIYLYPEAETEVSVVLGKPENLTVSYPHYDGGWNVLAQPNGDLVDLKTGRNLYALYYESLASGDFGIREEGFVVKGSEAASFLEEKLAILGLNEHEAEEFIVYWLPVLEANEYNYIHFESADLINEKMPLTVTPSPDNVIRIWMSFKSLDAPIEVSEQKLETPTRGGFTVVEWGGASI